MMDNVHVEAMGETSKTIDDKVQMAIKLRAWMQERSNL